MEPLPYKSLAGIILAAGGSSRLGYPKQLCEWRGMPLICNAVEASLAVCGAGVIVVTGAHAPEVESVLHRYPVQTVRNPDWSAGMSGSLRTGLQNLCSSEITGVLVSLGDQPLVSGSDLASLVAAWRTLPGMPAVAEYKGVQGVPAIFPDSALEALLTLQGDAGARSLLDACLTVSSVEMPSAAIDIDTVEDLAWLKASNPEKN
jgi:molybdenum cofactor cytidylyltransferase